MLTAKLPVMDISIGSGAGERSRAEGRWWGFGSSRKKEAAARRFGIPPLWVFERCPACGELDCRGVDAQEKFWGPGCVTCVSGRGESGPGSKPLASVLQSPFGYTSGVVCRRARLMAEDEATLGAVKSSSQPVRLSEKFARSEAFHNAHESLTAGTGMARYSWRSGRDDGREHVQQLSAKRQK